MNVLILGHGKNVNGNRNHFASFHACVGQQNFSGHAIEYRCKCGRKSIGQGASGNFEKHASFG